MRAILVLAVLSVLAPGIARAQDCVIPVNSVQMSRSRQGLDLIPVSINGVKKNFLFDTGGAWTSISKDLATELSLPVEPGKFRMRDISGNVSTDKVRVREIQVGRIQVLERNLPVFSSFSEDGLYAPDSLMQYDVDVDFGTDKLTFLSPCPGKVPRFKSSKAVAVPLSWDDIRGAKLVVPVTLDGRLLDAVLDTGANRSLLRADIARRSFGVIPGEPGTPRAGVANGDPRLPVYMHQFKNLTFADIGIDNPRLAILSDASGPITDQFQGPVHAPMMILGMDVLRKMHLYFAFGEIKLYVTPASAPPGGPAKDPA